MNCPSCLAGVIRMVPLSCCPCGHPVMVCDQCIHGFMIKHDEKNHSLLPPEAELEDQGPFYPEEIMTLRQFFIMQGAWLTPEPVPANLPTVEEMHKLIEIFEGKPIAEIYSTLEDVQERLTDKLASLEDGETLTEREQFMFDAANRWIKSCRSV